MKTWIFSCLFGLCILIACSSKDSGDGNAQTAACPAGVLGCPCYTNGTCNGNYICESGECKRSASGQGGEATGTGGENASGGDGSSAGGETGSGGADGSGGTSNNGGTSSGGAANNGGTSSGGAANNGGTSSGGTVNNGGTANNGGAGNTDGPIITEDDYIDQFELHDNYIYYLVGRGPSTIKRVAKTGGTPEPLATETEEITVFAVGSQHTSWIKEVTDNVVTGRERELWTLRDLVGEVPELLQESSEAFDMLGMDRVYAYWISGTTGDESVYSVSALQDTGPEVAFATGEPEEANQLPLVVRRMSALNTEVVGVSYSSSFNVDIFSWTESTNDVSVVHDYDPNQIGNFVCLLTADDSGIYFNVGDLIYSATREPNSATPIATLPTGETCYSLQSDAQNLYFIVDTSVYRVPKAGGTPTPIVTLTQEPLGGLRLDDTYLYYNRVDNGVSQVARIQKP